MAISSISAVNAAVPGLKPLSSPDAGENQVSFKDMLMNALNDVNGLQQQSGAITEDFIAGRTDSIQDVMIASTQASLATDFLVEVRNKVLDAYQEIMRMQI